MAKFVLEGLNTPLVGDIISDDGISITIREESGDELEIPRSRVIFVRKDVGAAPRKPIIKTGDGSPNPLPPSSSVPPLAPKTEQEKKTEMIRDAFKNMVESKKQKRTPDADVKQIMGADAKSLSGLSQIDPPPEPLTYDPNERTSVDVIFEGAKSHAFRLNLPIELMNRGYTPALGREIFKNPEVKSFINGVVLTSVPEVTQTTVTYNTEEISDAGTDVVNKLGVAAKTMSMASSLGGPKPGAFKKPEGVYETGFAMKNSPFESLPILRQSGPEE